MRITMRIDHPSERVVVTAKKSKVSAVKTRRVEEPRATYSAGKQRLNITVRGDLIERAREAGLNISSVVEESLTERLRKAEGERWLAENAQAIAHHNARIEREGLWHKGLTPWY